MSKSLIVICEKNKSFFISKLVKTEFENLPLYNYVIIF